MESINKTVRAFVLCLAITTLFSGLVNLYSVIGPSFYHHNLLEIVPLEFISISRFATLVIGFFLIISSINIGKRKRRAWQLVTLLATLSIFFHIFKGLNYAEALSSLILLILLLISNKYFTVKSSLPNMRLGIVRLAISLVVALVYGIAGFYLLSQRHFGINFSLLLAIKKTLLLFSLADAKLMPHTRYARWFINSIYLQGTISLAYACYALYRPVAFRFKSIPQDRLEAKRIIEAHGQCSLDFFKTWPDKHYFFSPSRQAFFAYRVANNFAITLGDPVGPAQEIKPLIKAFLEKCRENDWRCGFHQTLPDFLPIYQELGLRAIKIGYDAIVDLRQFNLAGASAKNLRNEINRLERERYRARYYAPEIAAHLLDKLKSVSDEWLTISGRRERRFTLGHFDREYLKSTPIFTVENADGDVIAFANLIHSYHAKKVTIDLMRRRVASPNGVMDFLFIKLFAICREQGYETFNLGLSPLAGVGEDPDANSQERALHIIYQNFNYFFSYQGLKKFKAKFATYWQPRYLIYQNFFHLPEFAIALARVSEMEEDKYKIWELVVG